MIYKRWQKKTTRRSGSLLLFYHSICVHSTRFDGCHELVSFFFFSQSVTDVRWGCQTLKKDVKWPRPSWKPLQWKKLSAILAHSQTSTDRRCHQIGPNYVHIRLRSNWNRIAARSWTNDLTDDPIIHLLLPGCQLVWVSSYQRKSQWNKPTAAVRACTRG